MEIKESKMEVQETTTHIVCDFCEKEKIEYPKNFRVKEEHKLDPEADEEYFDDTLICVGYTLIKRTTNAQGLPTTNRKFKSLEVHCCPECFQTKVAPALEALLPLGKKFNWEEDGEYND